MQAGNHDMELATDTLASSSEHVRTFWNVSPLAVTPTRVHAGLRSAGRWGDVGHWGGLGHWGIRFWVGSYKDVRWAATKLLGGGVELLSAADGDAS
jgi:hypothetical protein